jgi:hypothetical protein
MMWAASKAENSILGQILSIYQHFVKLNILFQNWVGHAILLILQN